MPLSGGDRLGHYEVISLLDQSGMGEVCRVKDAKLDRDVAITVLPHVLARDPERLARFEREAKVLTLLDHPLMDALTESLTPKMRAGWFSLSSSRTAGPIEETANLLRLMIPLRIRVAEIASLYKDIGNIYATAVQRARAQHRCAGGANGYPQNNFSY